MAGLDYTMPLISQAIASKGPVFSEANLPIFQITDAEIRRIVNDAREFKSM